MANENGSVVEVHLTPREQGLEEELHLHPIPRPPKEELPDLEHSIEEFDVHSLEGDIKAMYQVARDAYELSKTTLDEAEDMADEKAKASALANAVTALTAAMSAIEKATRIKVKAYEIKKEMDSKEENGDDYVVMDRNTMARLLKQQKGDDFDKDES